MSKVIKKAKDAKADENQEILINELLEVFKQVGYTVRIEKGLFKGGFCLLREQKVFLMNKNIEPQKKIVFLAKNLGEIGVEGISLKPVIRELIEKEGQQKLL